jgi:hypothetical protein
MSINRKKAIITFDYEVFLGRHTGTIHNSVLKPTYEILKILQINNARAIFFVDAAWLIFIKENSPEDFNLIAAQLNEITVGGSSVELHLHPQWLNAEKINGHFILNSSKNYKISTSNIREIHDIFNRSVELLETITGQKPCCFRAGGWCIEPFDLFKDIFDAFKIKYDFSVAPGLYIKEGEVFDFDFSDAPHLPFYRFQNDVLIPQKTGKYFEVPVSTYLNNPFYRFINRLLIRAGNDKIFGDGIGIKEKSFFTARSLYQHVRFSHAMLTLDKTNSLFFRYLLQTHFNNIKLLVIVSHPKTVSVQALTNLSIVSKKYDTLNSSDLQEQLNFL